MKRLIEKLETVGYENFSVLPDAVIVTDAGGRVLYANPQVEATFGWPVDELLGQPIEVLVPEAVRDKHAAHRSKLSKTSHRAMGVIQGMHGRRRDGTLFPVDVSLSSIPYKDDLRVIAVIRDQTRSTQQMEKIRLQAWLLDEVPDALWMRNIDGNVVYANRSAEVWFGGGATLLGKQDRHFLQRAGCRDCEWFFDELVAMGEKQMELQLTDETGGPRNLLVRGKRVDQVDDVGFVIVATDITRFKKLQGEFYRTQRLESLGTLAGGIAHDLNNILTPMMLSIEVLQRPSSEGRDKMLSILNDSTRRGKQIVAQILQFSRGRKVEYSAVAVTELIDEVVSLARGTFPRNIEIVVAVQDDLWPVLGDAGQVHQVLLNLMINTRDAMSEGGVLSISASNRRIDRSYEAMHFSAEVGDYVQLSVADTGEGMSPEVLARVFEPFFTTKEQGEGSGIGLSTVFSIVRSHGGFINAYSELGQGAHFNVCLPAGHWKARPDVDPMMITDSILGEGELILLVDDEESILQITRQVLESCNYCVITASDGVEAVALFAARRKEIALVLTDIRMPNMNGSNLIQVLRKMDLGVKIVATSGLSGNELAYASGADRFLTKPYPASNLLAVIAELLGKVASEKDQS